ncbi:MAG TPA: cupin domain-containing protein [Solirubrobacteraceae bacterium]|jgi:quercetin dioxygenase-like cupin family protein|nr:cupin domain-containing protein [Solirubrobacteraceae bacterium]
MTPQVVWMPGGVRTEVHVGGAESAGALCVLVDEPPPGWSLPAHRHANESETIHVLAGSFRMQLRGRSVTLAAGDTLHVPLGAVHSGGNVGSETGRRVVIFAPAGIEGFFLSVGAPQPDGGGPEADLLAAARRYGWEFLPG